MKIFIKSKGLFSIAIVLAAVSGIVNSCKYKYLLVLVCIMISNIGFTQDYKRWRDPNIKTDTILEDYSSLEINGINISYTNIRSKASFSKAQFDSLADFERAEFHSLGNFVDSKFHSEAVFYEAKFHSLASFTSAEFDSLPNFLGTKYAPLSSPNNRIVIGYGANFENAEFHSKAEFNYVKFKTFALFNFAEFDSVAEFAGAEFHSEAQFIATKFHSDAIFIAAKFDSLANFRRAQFNHLILRFSVLPEILSLEAVSTSNIIDLTRTKLDSANKICYINLFDAPIEKIKMRYDKFRIHKPKILLDSITPEIYEKFTYVYEGLLKNFKDHGYLTSYETLDKEYQEFMFTNKPNRNDLEIAAGNTLNWLNKNWNDYGYDKIRIWYITLLFFTVFTFINWLRFPQMLTLVYQVSSLKKVFMRNKKLHAFKEKHNRYPYVNIRTPLLAFYYTALIFFGLKLSIENMKFDKPLSILYIFLQYTIGLICLAYLANYVISSTLIGS